MFFTRKRLKLYLGALVIIQVCTVISGLAILCTVRGRYIDLRTFYTAGYMLRTRQAALLYDYPTEQRLQTSLVSYDPRALPMMSPPFTALLFVPLSHLSIEEAHVVFAIVDIVLLAVCVVLLQPFLTSLSARWRPAPTLLIFSFLPAWVAILVGQLSVVLLLLYCIAFVCLRRKHDVVAGLVVSLAMMKFQVAIPVAILFLLWRQWRFIAGFLTGSAVLAALSIRIVGTAPFLAYLHSLYSMTSAVSADPVNQLRFAIIPEQMPNLYGTIFMLTRGAAWCHILILAISLVLFLWTARQRPSLALALMTAMLVSYHLFFYDLTLLVLPLAMLADHLLRNPDSTQSPDLRLLTTRVSLGMLLLSPMLRLLTGANDAWLLTLPMLALTVSSAWWPSLHGEPEPAPMADAAVGLAAAM